MIGPPSDAPLFTLTDALKFDTHYTSSLFKVHLTKIWRVK